MEVGVVGRADYLLKVLFAEGEDVLWRWRDDGHCLLVLFGDGTEVYYESIEADDFICKHSMSGCHISAFRVRIILSISISAEDICVSFSFQPCYFRFNAKSKSELV